MLATLIRFGGVGGLATLVHVLVALTAEHSLSLSAQQANLAGFLVSVLLSYFGHAHVTFRSGQGSALRFLRFVVVALTGYAVSSLTVALITGPLGLPFAVAMVAVAMVVPATSFVAMRFWVFRGSEEGPSRAGPDLALCVVLALGVVVLFWNRLVNHDVGWYLIAARAWQGGAGLYTDLMEVNPPLNFYLTLPALWIADALGVSDRNGQYVVVAALFFVSLSWSAAVLRRDRSLPAGRRALLLVASGLAMLIPSLSGLGQRDQLLVLFLLPWAMHEALPHAATRRGTIASALFAAAGVCLKPHFVVLPLAVTALNCLERRSLRPVLSPANLVFLVCGLAYIAFVRIVHPAYFADLIGMALRVYGAYGAPLPEVLSRIAPLMGPATLTFAISLRSRPSRPVRVFAALAVGGLGSYFLQGTGFGYHQVPFLTFAAITCCMILFQPWRARAETALSAVMLLALLANGIQRGFYHNVAVAEIAAALAEQGPFDGVLTLSSHVTVGPPVALALDTSWASRYSSQWLVPGAINALDKADCRAESDLCDTLRSIAARNRSDIIRDMNRARPALLIVDRNSGYFDKPGFDWLAFMAEDPAWPAVFADYRQLAVTGHFLLFLRQP